MAAPETGEPVVAWCWRIIGDAWHCYKRLFSEEPVSHFGVSNVTVVSPGVTRTEFLEVAGQQPSLYQRTMMMESPEVTRIAIDALLSGKASVVPGFMNALLAESTRLMPRQLAVQTATDQPAGYLLRCPVIGGRRPEGQLWKVTNQ